MRKRKFVNVFVSTIILVGVVGSLGVLGLALDVPVEHIKVEGALTEAELDLVKQAVAKGDVRGILSTDIEGLREHLELLRHDPDHRALVVRSAGVPFRDGCIERRLAGRIVGCKRFLCGQFDLVEGWLVVGIVVKAVVCFARTVEQREEVLTAIRQLP